MGEARQMSLFETLEDDAPVDSLSTIAAQVRACEKCGLCRGRTNAVPGEGAADADLMWIGEGPGADEDRLGRPFVGRSGQLLTRMIRSMGMSREQVFIGNVVKCRPPNNRAPLPDEIETCLPYLERQIALIRPRVIVLLGASALHALVSPGASITRMRGQWLKRGDAMVMPTFHPAALLRDPSKNRLVWEDMKKVMLELG
jgi:uracil-DNA glycosylase family 4